MKTLYISLVIGMLAASGYANAKDEKNHPCNEIRKACKAASKGDKASMHSCMKSVMTGGKVENVSVGDDVIAACKEKREERRELRSKNQGKEKVETENKQ